MFFAALICSQLSRTYHSAFVDLNDFRISENQIAAWISELDPSARFHGSSTASGQRGNEVDSEFDAWISADVATAEQTLSYLRNSAIAKAEADEWSITAQGQGGDESFQFSLSKGDTRFKIYCWALTSGKSSFEERLEREGKNVFRIMVLQIGYARG